MPYARNAGSRETPPPRGGSASETVAAGPPPLDQQEEDKGPKPLGVPSDYRARPGAGTPGYYPHGFNYNTRSYGEGAPGGIKPRYNQGDEWRPASISPANMVEIQRALATAGLLDPDFRPGFWDRKSADAYSQVLEYANAAGITDQQALQQLAETAVDRQYVNEPLQVHTTSREDLRRLFRTVSADKLGVAYNAAQIEELVDAYQFQEIQVQRENYANEQALKRTAFEQGPEAVAGQEMVSTEAPSPEAFAEAELMRRDPTGVHAGAVVNQGVGMFRDALAAWGP